MADIVSNAWVSLGPVLPPDFPAKAKALIQAGLAGVKASVPLTADTSPFNTALAGAAAKLAVLDDMGNLRLNLDNNAAMMGVAEVFAATAGLAGRLDGIPVSLDDAPALAELFTLQAMASKILRATSADSSGPIDISALNASFYKLEAQTNALEAQMSHLNMGVDAADAFNKLIDLTAATEAVKAKLATLRANVDDTAALAKIAGLQVKANALGKALLVTPAGGDFTPLESQLLAVTAGYDKVKASTDAAAAATANAASAARGASIVWGSWGGTIGSIASARVPLFAGAIGAMIPAIGTADTGMLAFANHLVNVASGVTLAAHAVIEFAAVWIPATVAVGIFAAAAVPTVQEITAQLKNMNTAATGTGLSFDSLALSGQSVTDAVKPSVLEAFGIGLYALQHDSSNLAGAMHTLGQDVDQWAAKAAVAFDSKAMGTFMTDGVADANMLAQSFQSLGSIIGTLLKAVPGYAGVLLQFGNDVLGVVASVAKLAEPVIAAGLAFHGAAIYGGLFGTAVAKVFPMLVAGATAATEALAGIATKFLATDSAIVEGLGNTLLGLDALSAGPVIAGIGLVVGALAGLYLYLKSSKTEADDFNASIQKTVSSASLGALATTIQAGLTQTTTQYVQAQNKLAAATKTATDAQAAEVAAGRGGEAQYLNNAMAVQRAQAAVAQYHGGLVQLTSEQTNVNSNLAQLAKQFGVSIPGALSLANTAQITSSQLTATGAANYNTMAAQIGGAVAQLRVMTAGTGTLNMALNALNITQASGVTDAQKLGQAYGQLLGIITGGDSAFVTFENGMSTLGSALNSASAGSVTFTDKAGQLEVKGTAAGASMNGLSAASLNARSAFDSQVQAGVTLYSNLQTLATVSGNTTGAQVALAKAGKDLVAQLLPLAAGSQTAQSEVYALAQIVGYTGANSLPALTKAFGSSKGAEADLNTQTTILTTSSANLTQAAKALAAAVGSEVTSAEAAAIAATTNLSGVTLNLAKAVSASQGAASASVITYATDFYNALIKAGEGTTQATGDVDTFLHQLGATSGTVDAVNAALAKLPKQVNIGVNIGVQISQAQGANGIGAGGLSNSVIAQLGASLGAASGGIAGVSIPRMAPGGIVRAAAGYPAGRDSVLAVLAPGEMVVPASHTPAFSNQARTMGIPGFDAGGVPYSYGMTGYTPASSAGTAPGMPGATTYQAATTNQLLADIRKLLAQMPYSQAQAINQAQGQGVRRAWFGTGG